MKNSNFLEYAKNEDNRGNRRKVKSQKPQEKPTNKSLSLFPASKHLKEPSKKPPIKTPAPAKNPTRRSVDSSQNPTSHKLICVVSGPNVAPKSDKKQRFWRGIRGASSALFEHPLFSGLLSLQAPQPSARSLGLPSIALLGNLRFFDLYCGNSTQI